MPSEDTRRRYLGRVAAGASAVLAGCSGLATPGPTASHTARERENGERVDDWQYDPDDHLERSSGGTTGGGNVSYQVSAEAEADAGGSAGDSVGLAAGGAKDVNTFRRNVREGYVPQPDDVAPEGLFYDYYFDTGEAGDCSSLFCPSYSAAVTADPLSGETERYLTVGLNSGLSAAEFDRKALNLVVVLDVSGSMSSPFSAYHYDRVDGPEATETPASDPDRPKIDVARDALVALTEQLRPDDRLGVVLYNQEAAVAKPLRRVGDTDMDAIRDHVRADLGAGGGTNLDAGLRDATAMLREYRDADPDAYENRLAVVTDAMPNVGRTNDDTLRDRLEGLADDRIHATFVGVGLDFNAELVDEITAVRGANYYAVHSAEEFERRLGEEFEYMVTPLVFDLDLELAAEGYEIESVYGSTAADEATGRLMHVDTLFPSAREAGATRGGVVLVKLRRTGEGGALTLTASWEDREGRTDETATTVEFPAAEPGHFANDGVRKAVLLARYADLLRNWAVYERDADAVAETDGIARPPERLGRWEQQSVPLGVSDRYAARIRTFREHFRAEAEAIGDDALGREVELLDRILATGRE